MITYRIISVLTATVFLFSSLGITIMEHDPACCGKTIELYSPIDLLEGNDGHCSDQADIDNCCELLSHTTDCCSNTTECSGEECCQHELLMLLPEITFAQVVQIPPVGAIDLQWIEFVRVEKAENQNLIVQQLDHPPPLKIPGYSSILTGVFHC